MRNPFARRAEPELVRARIGVFGFFATSGFLMGCWAAGLPALDERLSLGPGRLGTVLLLIASGALVSMLIVGRLCDRFTSRRVARIAGPVTAVLMLGPVLSGSYPMLLGAGVLYGLSVGVIEVSMNVNSVEVEARYARPIVSAFHGLWSAGGAIGGAGTSLGAWLGLGSQTMLVAAIIASGVSFCWFGRYLLPPPAEHLAAAEAPRNGTGGTTMRWGLVLLLGIVAFAGHISEGAAIDWAAVHARRILDTPLSTAPVAYTVFGTAMTVVRLLGDPIRARLGAARTLLLAGSFATGGYVLVLASPVFGGFIAACAGWACTGIGLATVVPVVFSAVGASGGAVGKALSMVTIFGSAGLLIGPAVIGHLAELAGLPVALIVPGCLALLVAAAGPAAVRALSAHSAAVRRSAAEPAGTAGP